MANKPCERKQPQSPSKMHLYVNGKHTIEVDPAVAHAVAESYMSQGDSVWLSRQFIDMDAANRPNPKHRRARAKRTLNTKYAKHSKQEGDK